MAVAVFLRDVIMPCSSVAIPMRGLFSRPRQPLRVLLVTIGVVRVHGGTLLEESWHDYYYSLVLAPKKKGSVYYYACVRTVSQFTLYSTGRTVRYFEAPPLLLGNCILVLVAQFELRYSIVLYCVKY